MTESVSIRRSEVETGNLPPVCICCGGSSVVWERRNYTWRGGSLAAAPNGMGVLIPVCHHHRDPFKKDQFYRVALRLVSLAVFPTTAVMPFLAIWAGGNAWIAFAVDSLCLLCFWLIAFLILRVQARSVGIDYHNPNWIGLRGVHPLFKRALKDWRLGPEAFEADGDPSRFPDVFLAEDPPMAGVFLPSEGGQIQVREGRPNTPRPSAATDVPQLERGIQSKGDS